MKKGYRQVCMYVRLAGMERTIFTDEHHAFRQQDGQVSREV
jgi:hypothetical protein